MGKITGLTDKTVTLEVAEKIRLRVLRSHIAGKQSETVVRGKLTYSCAQPPVTGLTTWNEAGGGRHFGMLLLTLMAVVYLLPDGPR